MYRLLLLIFVIVRAVAGELSDAPLDANYHAQRTEHLRRASTELNNYFDEWVRQPKKRLESFKMISPHPPIPAPYPDWLANQEEQKAEETSKRMKNVHASLPKSRNFSIRVRSDSFIWWFSSKVSKYDMEEVFGDKWYRIIDEAFRGVPVKLEHNEDDSKTAYRMLEYLLKGNTLARRLGTQSAKDRSFRYKRDMKKPGLEPWQEAVLRSVIAHQPTIPEVEVGKKEVILASIKDQLEGPEDEYNYEDEMRYAAGTNVSGEDTLDDSEYYDEEGAEDSEGTGRL